MLARLTCASVARAIFASAIWLTCAAAHAQSIQTGSFVADEKSGCNVWDPHPEPNEAVSWSGSCVNGFAQGAGRLQWLQNGKAHETDEGEWSQGRQIGRGTQSWGSGRYDGELSGGEPQGRGILALRTARYEGEFRNGKPNGSGTMTGLNGLYKGTWKDGCLVGDKRRIAFAVSSSSCP
jgi:hypothetical protein